VLADPKVTLPEVIAVSACHLNGLYLDCDYFADFRALEPIDRAGYSIFIYDLKDPGVQRALGTARSLWRERESGVIAR
jgi:hypothetical protein